MVEEGKLIFHAITLKDKDWMLAKLREDARQACEYTFTNNFIWSEVYKVEVGSIYGCGVVRYWENEKFVYSFPFGNGDKKEIIRLLQKMCTANGQKLCLYPLIEADRLNLMAWFGGEFLIEAKRDGFDYIYTVEKLSSLKGRKLHGKRNHIARFMDDGDWSYEPLTAANKAECGRMAELWITSREDKWNSEMEQEMRVMEKALLYYEELGLVGGVLRKKSEIVAFEIGERLTTDTMVVHFEKAFPDLQGAYPMINQQFVLHACQGYTYVNREEDVGDMGLRRAKLSYYPDILLTKYYAEQSEVVFASERDKEQIIELWQECFGDSREYISLYLQKRFDAENMLVIYKDGRIVSMASFLPAVMTINGEKIQVRYVYAVGTLMKYRNQGYAAKIIQFAADKYNQPLVLQPADSRWEYYKGLGFQSCFHKDKWKMTVVSESTSAQKQCNAWNIESALPAVYKAIRDRHFSGEGFVEWDEEAIDYAIAENAFCAGKTLILGYKEEKELLMYRVEGNVLRIVETTLAQDEIHDIIVTLMHQTGTKQAMYEKNGGMILLPHDFDWDYENGYLNLTLG